MAAKTETDICFVCLEELKQDEALTLLSCGHKLHVKCQFSYSVAKKTGRMLCGMCRASIMDEQHGYFSLILFFFTDLGVTYAIHLYDF